MKTLFFGDFSDRRSIEKAFQCTLSPDQEILLAWYGAESYSGYAFVLFREGTRLYEVNGAHCSCYGLEDQWEPEETSIAVLKKRKFDHYYEDASSASSALQAVLAHLERQCLP